MADGNIRVPETLMAEVLKTAQEERRSPEEVVCEAVERYLQLKRQEKLRAYGGEQ